MVPIRDAGKRTTWCSGLFIRPHAPSSGSRRDASLLAPRAGPPPARTIHSDLTAKTFDSLGQQFQAEARFRRDGQVSAIAGTHNKALSADECILPRGTGMICDTGRTGSIDSVGGLDIETEIGQFITQIPERSKEAWDGLEMQGVIFEINAEGRSTAVERVRIPCREVPDERKSES